MPNYDEMRGALGGSMFVKPVAAGSSVGVSHVKSDEEWAPALEAAAQHGRSVMIEKAVQAREIEIAVLGNEIIKTTTPGEIIPGDEFYSYEDKYGAASTSKAVIPAGISPDVAQKIKYYAVKAYDVTGCRGLARIDFFVDPQNEVYLNEINSIPGFTNISMYPKLWQHEGMKYPQLIDRLIELARE